MNTATAIVTSVVAAMPLHIFGLGFGMSVKDLVIAQVTITAIFTGPALLVGSAIAKEAFARHVMGVGFDKRSI